MRILQINSVYGYGSTGRIVKNLHDAIQNSGHESFVIYGRGEKSEDKNVFRIGNKIEQAIDLVGTRLFNKHGQYSLVSTQKIINKIKEIDPDIVHLHNLHGYYVNFIKLIEYLKQTKIKIIWLLHDTWLISGSSALKGGLEYEWENKPNYKKLKQISKEYPSHIRISSKQSHINYKLKKELLSNTNITFVTPSNWLSNVLKNSFLKDNDIKVVHNGIDIEKFKILYPEKTSPQKNILGVASIWEKSKGLNYFEKLAEDLDDQYTITVVGVTQKQEKKISPRINCINRTNSIKELVKLYNQADVFVNPTLFDNFPTVNLEAQSCGTPVITFNTGGSGESVISGKTGKIIEAGNYNELLKSIERIPKKNRTIMKICRKNIKQYSLETFNSQYIRLYHDVLKII